MQEQIAENDLIHFLAGMSLLPEGRAAFAVCGRLCLLHIHENM